MKNSKIFLTLLVGTLLFIIGCTSSMSRREPLDIRAFKIEPTREEENKLKIVLGVKDFEGLFSEEYRSDTLLTTEERKRWRDMGVKSFPDALASYLQARNIVLDATRAGLENADLILEGKLHKFCTDTNFSSTQVQAIYAPVTFDNWKVKAEIDADFRLSTPNGRKVAEFKVALQMPEVVERREKIGITINPSILPPLVEEKLNKSCRNFFKEVLYDVESKFLEERSDFSFLERPDLGEAQNQSDELLTGKPRNQWAVVIGISRYFRGGAMFPDLQFADRDANEFCNFLMSPEGGGFKKDRVLLLTNAEATYSSIRHALFTFLKDAQSDDLVIIYFSGHGAPDPDRPDNLYLIPYDVEPDNLSGSAFPMWDIEKVLWKTIMSQRVIVLADACHSAGVSPEYGTKGVKIEASENVYNKYFRRLAHIRPGRVVFSSSNGYEQSLESTKWDRHGVFTWALLKALKGEADGFTHGTEKDNIVSLHEMIEYVKYQVENETNSKQHPFLSASPKYDTELPLAIVSNKSQEKLTSYNKGLK
ncbi:MAG: caspase domain-containing protein [Candidatus Scalinduaceae bacterium]